ncbi:MAG: hypothetical protein ACR2NP_03210 [Pirellulaceae bacterium]
MKRFAKSCIGMQFVLVALFAFPVVAQTQDDERRNQLSERQRMVERSMAELEAKFEIIAQKLEEKEPERAARLVQALQQAKENLIARKMAEITRLLDEQKLEEAEAELDAVILNLEALVRLLLNEQEDTMSRQEEIDKLKQWREQIVAIKREQQRQTDETDKIANKDETLRDLEEQIRAVEELIEKQESVIDETDKNRGAGLQALDGVADQQFDVRQETEELAEEIAGDTESSAEELESDPSGEETQPGEQSGQQQSGQQQEGQQQAGQQQEGQQQEGQQQEGQQQEGQQQEGQQQEGQQPSGQQQSGQQQSGQQQSQQQQNAQQQHKQPGQQPLEDAAGNQRQAEEELTNGRAARARNAEEAALEDLKEALAELKKEQRRIASLPPEAFQKMAQEQRRTENKTEDLARDMQNTPQSGQQGQEGQQGQSGQQQQQQGQPGQQSVQRAQKAMQNAAGDLAEQDPERAVRQQEKAEEELDKALREIEERLDQLREETREEKLARLEARFREMLMRQQIATIMTVDLDDKKTHLGKLRRRDLLTILRLSSEELEISELGQQAYDLLLEDGTSIVFPEMVQQTRDDLGRVAQLLESEQTGPLTQLIQRDIEASLEEMLEALKQTRKNNEGGGGGGGGGNAPLLRKSAELKMLRAAQLRVNRLTKQFDLIRPDGTLEGPLKRELGNIRVRQADIVEMMIRIMEKEQ